MTNYSLFISGLSGAVVSFALFIPLNAQQRGGGGSETDGRYVRDVFGKKHRLERPLLSTRMCLNRDKHEERQKAQEAEKARLAKEGKGGYFSQYVSENVASNESDYIKNMAILIKEEIASIQGIVKDIQKKHDKLITLYPQFKYYQEINLEDIPGTYVGTHYLNFRKTVALHYDKDGTMNCLVIDYLSREIYVPNVFTQKFTRMYLPHVQSMEMETIQRQLRVHDYLDNAPPDMQLMVLRRMLDDLRSVAYSLDLQISAYYYTHRKMLEWQAGW